MDGINLYSIDYYKKTVFKGSYKGLCFRIGKAEVPATDRSVSEDADAVSGGAVDGGSDEMMDVLRVQAWKGPYVLEKTDEESFTEDFEFSEDGLNEANEWVERKQAEVA